MNLVREEPSAGVAATAAPSAPLIAAGPAPAKAVTRPFVLRSIRLAAWISLGLVGFWMGISFLGAWLLTRRVEPLEPEPTPDIAWGRVEPTRLRTSDDQDLGGWFIEGREWSAPSVLILHGHGGSRAWCLPHAEIFGESGCAVFLISMRAAGDSTGDSTDIGWSAQKDVYAAMDWLERRRPGRPIYIMGISMGAAAAIYASGEIKTRAAGYILESPYRDIRTAVKNRADIYLSAPWNKIVYSGLCIAAPAFIGNLDKLSPVDAIRGIPASVPVTILYGDKDNRARPEEAKDLFAEVKSHGKLVCIPGGRHWALRTVQPELYREALLDAVGRLKR